MACPAKVLPVAQEARTEVSSPDVPAVVSNELMVFGLDGTALFADETSKLVAVLARSGWELAGSESEGHMNNERDVLSIPLDSIMIWNRNQGRLPNR